MENYQDYSKEELIEMLEYLNKPLINHNEIAIRLCELLSCEHCPVVIHKCDKRTEADKCLRHAPCFGELHSWIKKGFANQMLISIERRIRWRTV